MAWPVLPFGFLGPSGDNDPYVVQKSLRFDGSAYLNRTFSTPTTQNTFTFSCWLKLGALGTARTIFAASSTHTFGFTSTNALNVTLGSSVLTTTGLFRDPSAWYHIVWSSNGAAGQNQTVYVNGVSVGVGTGTTSVNTVFNTAAGHLVGAATTTTVFFSGYMAEIHFVDGQALTPTSFAEDAPVANRWRPKAYTSTYGNNGFYLNFLDNSGVTSTTLGKDQKTSGTNNWTPNSFSVTSGTGDDSSFDSPTNSGTSGNYCTWNPLINGDTCSNGNLDVVNDTARGTQALLGYDGYWEITSTGGTTTAGIVSSTGTTNTTTIAAGKTYGFSLTQAGALEYINLTDSGSWTSITTGVTGTVFPYASAPAATTASLNCGQRSFVNSSFSSKGSRVRTTSLSQPVFAEISDPDKLMDTQAYAGDNTSKWLAASEFDVGLSWIKNRTTASTSNILVDATNGKGGPAASLLLHMSSANGGSTFMDSSLNGSKITVTNATLSTGHKKHGLSSGFFTTTSNQFLSLPTSSIFDFGSGDWTIEFWYKKNGTPQEYARIFQTADGDVYTGISIAFNQTGDSLRLDCAASTADPFEGPHLFNLTSTATVSSSEFRHFAFVRNGNSFKIYQNGVENNSVTATGALYYNASDTVVIGGQSGGRGVNGYIADLRVVKGTALYTSAFTPPTTELPDPSGFLATDSTAAQATTTVELGTNTNAGKVYVTNTSTLNASSTNYVNWRWAMGANPSENTSGSIKSMVWSNNVGKSSIVRYHGSGSNGTVGHGLNTTPAFIILKQRSGTNGGAVYHTGVGATKFLKLFDISTATDDAETTDNTVWNGSSPTFSSSVFSVGTSTKTNASGALYVAYCFSDVEGFSKFGSYTGNGSADGPFVWCGFRPKWILVKNKTAGNDWYIWDNQRSTVNVATVVLRPGVNNAELSGEDVDLLSNGFKIRDTSAAVNASTNTYVFAAFAQTPFKYARAR